MKEKPKTGAKKTTSASAAKKSSGSATGTKTASGKSATQAGTSAKRGTGTAKKSTSSGSGATRKTGTGTAKKSTSSGSEATRKTGTGTASKRLTSEKGPATTVKKKTTTGAKKSPQKPTAPLNDAGKHDSEAPKEPVYTPEKNAAEPQGGEPSFVPVALPTGALARVGDREISDVHPSLDFPERMVKSFFLRVGVIAVIALVLVVSAVIYVVRPVPYVERTSSVSFLFVPAESKTLIVVEGTVRGEAPGAFTARSDNGRGDTCAAMIGTSLYLIRGKNVISVAEGVLDFVLSADGSALSYRTSPSSLYYRTTGKKDTPSLISQNCTSSAYCLSANGKELAFVSLDDAGTAHLRIESYSGNRPYIEGTAGLSPVAICDGSRYVYYTDAEGGLYVFDSKKAQKIKCAAAPDLDSLIFNRDFTELLFTENGGTALFASGERRQIVGAASTEYLELLPNRRVASRKIANGTQFMLGSFYKNYFSHAVGTGKMLTYLDRKGNLVDVDYMDGAETVTVTSKGVYFLKSGSTRDLYHVKAGKTEATRIEWNVREYCTNVDGSRVMFTGLENALYVWRAETGATRLCDGIVPGSLQVTADDLFCFYRTQGLLAVSDNGAEVRDVMDGVSYFSAPVHSLFFITDMTPEGTFTVYVNYRGARTNERIASGIGAIW